MFKLFGIGIDSIDYGAKIDPLIICEPVTELSHILRHNHLAATLSTVTGINSYRGLDYETTNHLV